MHQPGFWRRVAEKDPSLFARLWSAVKRILAVGDRPGMADLGQARPGAMYDAEALMTEAGLVKSRGAAEALYREFTATRKGRAWERVDRRLAEARAQQGERRNCRAGGSVRAGDADGGV